MLTACKVCGIGFEASSLTGDACPSCDARPACSTYPSVGEVERATHEQLARWHRFLPSPGDSAIGLEDRQEFQRAMRWEGDILESIEARFKDLGGMNAGISKTIGWGDA